MIIITMQNALSIGSVISNLLLVILINIKG